MTGNQTQTTKATRYLMVSLTDDEKREYGRRLAALGASDAARAYRKVLAERCKFYGQIISNDRSQAVFAKGWTARLAEFMEQEV